MFGINKKDQNSISSVSLNPKPNLEELPEQQSIVEEQDKKEESSNIDSTENKSGNQTTILDVLNSHELRIQALESALFRIRRSI